MWSSSQRSNVFGEVDPENRPLESNTESLAVIQPKLYRFKGLPASPHSPREQLISVVGGGTLTMFGMDDLT